MAQTQRILDAVWGAVLGATILGGFVLAGAAPVPVANPHDRDLAALEARARALPAMSSIYLPPQGDGYMAEAILLQRVVENVMNVDVRYEPFGDELAGEAGFTDLDPRVPPAVHIDKALSWNARLEVLAHEAGHRLQPPTLPGPSSESEVFAQAVSYLVCLEFNRNTLEVSASYLALHKSALHVLTDQRKEIEYAVIVLTGGLK